MEFMKHGSLLMVALLGLACHAPREAPTLRYEHLQLEDGIYTGKAKGGVGSAEVEVTVRDGEIADVKILSGFSSPIGRKAFRRLPQRIVERRSVEVDAITGATYSSNIIKAAVREALNQAVPE